MNLFKRKKRINQPISMIGEREIPDDFRKSLSHWGYQITESDLLRCISENRYKMAVYYAVVCLSSLGSERSIPLLKTLIDYPKYDVQVCAVLAIGAIGGSKETKYFSKLLDSRFKHKLYVMSVLWEVGDESALPAVVRLGEKIKAGKIVVRSQSEVLYVTEYLKKYSDKDYKNLIGSLEEKLPKLDAM
jgi:hypothetical protein